MMVVPASLHPPACTTVGGGDMLISVGLPVPGKVFSLLLTRAKTHGA